MSALDDDVEHNARALLETPKPLGRLRDVHCGACFRLIGTAHTDAAARAMLGRHIPRCAEQ